MKKQSSGWIRRHWKLFLVYLPLLLVFAMGLYTGAIYITWQNDRDQALDRLARYKKLIDRTEELKRGMVYSYRDVDLSARVVDIPTRIYDRNNELIGEFFEQKREIVPYDQIPEWIVKGVIASEDREFYNHNGLDYSGILRAMFQNIIHMRIVQGGSTITQQLAKVLFTDMERSIKRKIYEAFCAREIERLYDKQDILSMYLNLIYFGNGAYGVEAASQMFFGQSVKRCDIAESAMIVATISNPAVYSPLEDLARSVAKTRRILNSMVETDMLEGKRAKYHYRKFLKRWEVEFDKKGKAVSSLIGTFAYSAYRINRAPFFNERIRRILVDKFGEEVLKKGGLSVYTTIDGNTQDYALAALRKGIERQRNYHAKRAKSLKGSRAAREMGKAENTEGALVALDPHSGEILAYVGGYRFSARNQNDHVSQIRRQPGSSFKPMIYVSAIEERTITPSTKLENRKVSFEGTYSPENYDREYSDNVIAREALVKSINIPAVHVLKKTGYDRLFETLEKALENQEDPFDDRFTRTLSIALGSYEISPLESSILHSLLVNGGQYIRPYGIRQVRDYNNTVVWDYEKEAREHIEKMRERTGTIIDPAAGAIVLSMLRGVLEKGGTASWVLRNPDFMAAGKTGTSSRYADAWFVGYTSRLVTSVWIGNKTGAVSLGPGRSGGSVAAPVWGEFIRKTFRHDPPPDFALPEESLTSERICLDSGAVAGRNGECPRVCEYQLFYSGTEPGVYCPLHVPGLTGEEKQ